MKTLLITGAQGIGKNRAAQVAVQIAEQHHGVQAFVLDENEHGRPRVPKGCPLLIRVRTNGTPINRALPKPGRIINLDRFPYPQGRAVAFAIREAVDQLIALEAIPAAA